MADSGAGSTSFHRRRRTRESTPGKGTRRRVASASCATPASPRKSGRWERPKPSSRTPRRSVPPSSSSAEQAVVLTTRPTALCARTHARSVLAQHGGTDPARVQELHAVQARMRDADPAVLDEQEDGHRLCPAARLWAPGPGGTQGEEEVQFGEYEEVYGRLSWGGGEGR